MALAKSMTLTANESVISSSRLFIALSCRLSSMCSLQASSDHLTRELMNSSLQEHVNEVLEKKRKTREKKLSSKKKKSFKKGREIASAKLDGD